MGKIETQTYGNLALDETTTAYRSIDGGKRKEKSRNAAKVRQMNVAYIVFLFFISALTVFIFMNYINVKTEYTIALRHKTALVAEYNAIKHENNITYHDKMAGVDYSKIKEQAINELGMRCPTQSQIVYYQPVKKDYVVQFENIPGDTEEK